MIVILPPAALRLRAFLSGIYPVPKVYCGPERRTRRTRDIFPLDVRTGFVHHHDDAKEATDDRKED